MIHCLVKHVLRVKHMEEETGTRAVIQVLTGLWKTSLSDVFIEEFVKEGDHISGDFLLLTTIPTIAEFSGTLTGVGVMPSHDPACRLCRREAKVRINKGL